MYMFYKFRYIDRIKNPVKKPNLFDMNQKLA